MATLDGGSINLPPPPNCDVCTPPTEKFLNSISLTIFAIILLLPPVVARVVTARSRRNMRDELKFFFIPLLFAVVDFISTAAVGLVYALRSAITNISSKDKWSFEIAALLIFFCIGVQAINTLILTTTRAPPAAGRLAGYKEWTPIFQLTAPRAQELAKQANGTASRNRCHINFSMLGWAAFRLIASSLLPAVFLAWGLILAGVKSPTPDDEFVLSYKMGRVPYLEEDVYAEPVLTLVPLLLFWTLTFLWLCYETRNVFFRAMYGGWVEKIADDECLGKKRDCCMWVPVRLVLTGGALILAVSTWVLNGIAFAFALSDASHALEMLALYGNAFRKEDNAEVIGNLELVPAYRYFYFLHCLHALPVTALQIWIVSSVLPRSTACCLGSPRFIDYLSVVSSVLQLFFLFFPRCFSGKTVWTHIFACFDSLWDTHRGLFRDCFSCGRSSSGTVAIVSQHDTSHMHRQAFKVAPNAGVSWST